MAGATLDRERFLKVLALAESDQDGEALAAIRKASAMARAAGMSLGEAAGEGESPASSGGLGGLERLQIELLRHRIADLERQLAQKVHRSAAYEEGKAEGWQQGYQQGARVYVERETYKDGYRAGYDAGQEFERAATNRAYSRGYADGQAAANQNTASTATKKRKA